MKKNIKNYNDKIAYTLLICITFIFNLIPILWLKGPALSDEIGTLSNVELLVNNNWSEYIATTGIGYYKYGQSLLYWIVLVFFDNTSLAYQLMLIINACFISLIPCIIYYFGKTVFYIAEYSLRLLIAILIGIIPFSFFWSKFVWAETVLIVCNWLILFILYKTTISNTKREKAIYSILLSFTMVFAYAAHVRGVVAIIAVILTVLVYKFAKKEWCVKKIPFFLSFVIFLIAEEVATYFFKSNLWIADIEYNSTGSLFELYKDTKFWSYRGVKTLVKTIIGWLYSCINSTYGLFAIGIALSIVIAIVLLMKKKVKDEPALFITHFFIALSFLGCFALGLIFFVPGTFSNFYEGSIERMDKIIYARYISCTLGPLMLIAFYHIINRTQYFNYAIKRIVGFIICIQGAFITFLSDYFENSDMAYIQIYSLPILFPRINSITANASGVNKSLFILSIFTTFIVIIFAVIKNKRKIQYLVGGLVIVTTIINISNTVNSLVPINKYYYDTIGTISPFFDEMSDINKEYKNIVIGDIVRAQYPYQYDFDEYNIYRYEELYNIDNSFLVVDDVNQFLNSYSYPEYIYTINSDEDYANHLLIKGEKLKKIVQDRGIQLIQVN